MSAAARSRMRLRRPLQIFAPQYRRQPQHRLKSRDMASRGKKTSKAKAMTKAQMTGEIAAKTGLTKSQVQDLLAAQADVVAAELKAGRPVAIPGLVKISVQHKAATKAREGMNPFTKERMMFKAKPARNVVRVRALKGLKDMV